MQGAVLACSAQLPRSAVGKSPEPALPGVSRWHLQGQRWQSQSMEVSPCPQIASVDKVLQESAWWQSRIFAGRFSMMDEPNLNLPRADSLFSTLRVACLYHHMGGSWCSTSLYHPFHFNQGIGSRHDLAPNQDRISAFSDVFFKPELDFSFTLEKRLLMMCFSRGGICSVDIIAEEDKYHTYFISETNKERIKIPNIYTHI